MVAITGGDTNTWLGDPTHITKTLGPIQVQS